MKRYTVLLTKAEIGHIMQLIHANEQEGSYYGRKDVYWNRSTRLRDELYLSAHPELRRK